MRYCRISTKHIVFEECLKREAALARFSASQAIIRREVSLDGDEILYEILFLDRESFNKY